MNKKLSYRKQIARQYAHNMSRYL